MKYTKNSLCFLLMSGLSITLFAQSTISATGGNVNGSGGSVSYTVGQILYSSISGTDGTVVQGVQQPYEISVVTSIKNIEDINLKCLVYPNPTAEKTKLVFESADFENLSFRLFDINGVLLLAKKVESRETEISLENLSSSVYFLKIIKNNQEVRVFKIVKR
jgi:hypothetical protein